eukprot:s793_g7.t1
MYIPLRGWVARLGNLDQALQPDRGPMELDDSNTPDASWLSEVSAIRLQLAVVARRLRNARNMLRRLESMVPDDASMGRRLTGYLQDVSDDVDGALEDASHLMERCNALSSAYDAALSREHAAQRRVAKEAERIEQVKQNRHAQKLNDILFVLTTATALFAPVQFLAGVYGMNFAIDGDPTIPELKLEYGYLYFWAIVIIYIFGSGTLAVRLFRKLRIQQEAAHLLRNRQNTFSTLAGESPRVLEGISDLEPWLTSLATELVGRLREDPTRQPRSLVLYHRGRLDSDHGRNWMAGRTSELTKTISRSMAFPDLQMSKGEIGPAAANIVAEAAKKMLLERVSSPFPCSRLALGASDFRKVEKGSCITSFFSSQKAKPQDAGPVGQEHQEHATQDDVLLTQVDMESEGLVSDVEDEPLEQSNNSKEMPAANVAEFHRASRLHFLGTWRERFECWRAEGGAGQMPQEHTEQLRKELAPLWTEDAPALWAHLDMDCFFVSVATRDAAKAGDTSISDEVPAAVVSGLGPSSEICSANYAARRAGVNTHLWFVERAMTMLPTLRLFPITSELLRSVEDTWKQVYQLLVTACNDVPDHVLMRSCDESAIRVTGFTEPVAWAEALRKAVFQQTGCTCSVGLGPTQLVAKMATKACKPNGVRRVLDQEVKPFIGDLPLKDMPQVGRAMAAKLQERGLEICSDIQALEKNRLREWFGVKGETLWLNAQGLDQESSLVPAQRKSVSAEMNWGIRCPDKAAAVKILFEVAKQLKDRLAVCKLRANHLTLKLKIAIPGWVEPIKKGGHGQCDDISRSSALPSAESSEAGDLEVLQRCALQLYDMISPDPVRLRGLGLAARLGSSGADGSNSRSPKKASAGTSAGSGSIARWLRKAPELRKQEPSKESTSLQEEPAEPAEPADVVDLDALEHQELRGDFGRCSSPPYGNIRSDTVPCPVCGRQIPAANADAHVNSHFDQSAVQPVQPVQPSRKRLRFSSEQQGARPADSDECVIIL